ncbi:MAG TPA: FtsQ-type POTRA domain-containing protein [Candidatus Aquicultor sp.]|jgi:cell division protein FtsQ
MVEGRSLARSKAEERYRKIAHIKRQRRLRVTVLFGSIFIIITLVYWLYNSSLFNITNIDVAGNKFIPSSKIAAACGVTENTSLLNVPVKDIRRKLLKDPWVQDAQVKRALPHTLRVDIVERTPIALISHANKFYMIDANKCVIAERPNSDGVTIPIITDIPVAKVQIGHRIVNSSLENAILCLNSMPASLRNSINLLSASSIDKLSLYNRANIEILYGEAKQAEDKNTVLAGILKKQGKQVVFIDIRSYPHSDPVIKRMDSVP